MENEANGMFFVDSIVQMFYILRANDLGGVRSSLRDTVKRYVLFGLLVCPTEVVSGEIVEVGSSGQKR